MKLEEFALAFERQSKKDMILRTERALVYLLGAIQEGYYAVMVGSRGESGSVGALTHQLHIAEQAIIGIIGFGKNGDHLKFTEYGVKPASGAKYEAYSTIPPPSAFADWIKRARLRVPDRYKTLALRARDRKRDLRKLQKRTGDPRLNSRIRSAFKQIDSHVSRRARSKVTDPESAARLRWAWAMVIKRKRYGYQGLRVIEKILRQEEATLRAILNGL